MMRTYRSKLRDTTHIAQMQALVAKKVGLPEACLIMIALVEEFFNEHPLEAMGLRPKTKRRFEHNRSHVVHTLRTANYMSTSLAYTGIPTEKLVERLTFLV